MRGVYRISESLFGRIALEFLSLAWFAAEFSAPLRQIPRTITNDVPSWRRPRAV